MKDTHASAIPYDKIDPELRELVQVMNATDCITTTGCCIGHGEQPICEVIFNVSDETKWKNLLFRILKIGEEFGRGNIDAYLWYRCRHGELYSRDWVLRIGVHPRTAEDRQDETIRVLVVKTYLITRLVEEIKRWVAEHYVEKYTLTAAGSEGTIHATPDDLVDWIRTKSVAPMTEEGLTCFLGLINHLRPGESCSYGIWKVTRDGGSY